MYPFANGACLTADAYGPLACFHLDGEQLVVDLRDMRPLARFQSESYGKLFDAFIVSQWRQWFAFEWKPEKDKYNRRLKSVSVDTGETIFENNPVAFTWSPIRIAGDDIMGLVHHKKGVMEFDRRTGELVGKRPECRDYDCVDPSGVALIQKSPYNVWLEVHGRRQQLDIKAMRKFLDAERTQLPRDPLLPSYYVDQGSKRAIYLHSPTLARSIVILAAEKAIVGFSVETGEFVFSMSPLPVHSLAYHPERDALIALGWSTLFANLDTRILMEIDLDTRQVRSSRPISCVSPDRKQDPAGFLCDHGRYAILPDNSILTVGTDILRRVPHDLQSTVEAR